MKLKQRNGRDSNKVRHNTDNRVVSIVYFGYMDYLWSHSKRLPRVDEYTCVPDFITVLS